MSCDMRARDRVHSLSFGCPLSQPADGPAFVLVPIVCSTIAGGFQIPAGRLRICPFSTIMEM